MGQSNKKQKQEARAAAAETMRLEKKRQKRRAMLFQGGIALAVVVIVVVVAIAVLQQRDDSQRAVDSGGPSPTGTNDVGAYTVGPDDAAVKISIVEDLQCPICQAYEAATGDLLDGYLADGDVQVAYHGVAFLDGQSTTDYSSRALAASGCVMDEGEDVWRAFHEQMYLQQPEEGTAGLTDDEIVAIAADAGADEDAVSSCVDGGTYSGWVNRATQSASDAGVTGTPTVTVDGETISNDPAALSAAVEQARAS